MSKEFDRLVAILRRLRSRRNGCPWDRKQTHRTVRMHLLAEVYELIEAIDDKNAAQICEELGDILMLVVFHAQIGREKRAFNIHQVVTGINAKLVRRHPHVFKGVKVKNIAAIITNWEQIKKQEKHRPSLLDGVPRHLPALMAAMQLQKKAARVGFDWKRVADVLAKVREEMAELAQARRSARHSRMTEELGDLLFTMVNLARFLRVDPEDALRRTNAKFKRRFGYIEQQLAAARRDIRTAGLPELDRLWNQAKTKRRR
jgi:tetrapyrrole methylase family protein/MazG family protein